MAKVNQSKSTDKFERNREQHVKSVNNVGELGWLRDSFGGEIYPSHRCIIKTAAIMPENLNTGNLSINCVDFISMVEWNTLINLPTVYIRVDVTNLLIMPTEPLKKDLGYPDKCVPAGSNFLLIPYKHFVTNLLTTEGIVWKDGTPV